MLAVVGGFVPVFYLLWGPGVKWRDRGMIKSKPETLNPILASQIPECVKPKVLGLCCRQLTMMMITLPVPWHHFQGG